MNFINDQKTISNLQSLIEKHQISIDINSDKQLANRIDYPSVKLNIENKVFSLYAHDEYDDFKIDNPVLHLVVVIRELEDYEYGDDYLIWCTQHSIDPAIDEVRQYHMSLRNIYKEIESIIGPIKSPVSDYDFELDSGIVHSMRNP